MYMYMYIEFVYHRALNFFGLKLVIVTYFVTKLNFFKSVNAGHMYTHMHDSGK